jgi:hypothetical protein
MIDGEKLQIIRGDSQSIAVTFEDEDGNALDLTGKTVFFTVKDIDDDADNDDDALIKKEVTNHTDPTAGKTTITIASTDTDLTPNDYVFDLQVKDIVGNIMSTQRSVLEVVADVTRRTS